VGIELGVEDVNTVLAPREQSFVLEGVDGESYETLLQSIGDRHVFITYDQGRLELLSPSWKHDPRSRRIAMLITILAEELEPDQCFYVRNVSTGSGERRRST
jgi:hypothetical protein